jgi:hypothetical protein
MLISSPPDVPTSDGRQIDEVMAEPLFPQFIPLPKHSTLPMRSIIHGRRLTDPCGNIKWLRCRGTPVNEITTVPMKNAICALIEHRRVCIDAQQVTGWRIEFQ